MSIREHTSAYLEGAEKGIVTDAVVYINHRAYVSIREHTHTSAYLEGAEKVIVADAVVYINHRAYVSIREHT